MDTVILIDSIRKEIEAEKQLYIEKIQKIVDSPHAWVKRDLLKDAISTIASCDNKIETIDKYIKIEQEQPEEE